MFSRNLTAVALCAAPLLLAGCVADGYHGGGYQPPPARPAPPPQGVYTPPPQSPPPPAYTPPPRAYTPPPPPPPVRQRPKRKVVRMANLNRYCKQRGYTGAGTKRNGQPVCIVTSIGFNTTYTSKVGNINYADVCRRQFRTSQYQVSRGRVNCIMYVD